jgi:ParB/RepB/Spo0J family partition protein
MPLQIVTKALSFFKPDPKQPRKLFAEADLLALGGSMKDRGQLQPVGARPDGTLLWGERRLRAAQLVGLKELQAVIADRPLSDTEIRLVQLTENLHRADLTGYEKWLACAEVLCGNPTWTQKDLAGHLHLSESMVVRLLSPSRCSAAWQEALREGKVGISDCYAASKLPEAEQAALLAMKLSGASRDQIEQAGRKARNGSGPAAVKVARIKCPVAGGAVVQISGEGISLDGAIEAAQEWVKEAKKASEQGLDAKTFERVCRDKAKRG